MANDSDSYSRPVRLPKKLPRDWCFQNLIDCCSPRQYTTLPKFGLKSEGYPVFGANGLLGYYSQFTHEYPVVGIGCRGTCGIIQRIPAKSYVNGNTMCLDDINEKIVSAAFLYHALTYRNVTDAVTGSAQPQITRGSLRRVVFPLPPAQEQSKIVAILDAMDSAVERTMEAVERIQLLRRSIMQEMLPPWIGFRHLAAEQLPSGVDSIETAKDVMDICNGSTPSREEGRYWRNGTIPWLPTGKVNDRIITSANEFVTESALRECSIAILPRGTVLVGMIGQGKTRGMCAFLDMESCINQNFGAYVPRRKVHGKWLFYYLDYHYTRLREIGGGTNQGALNCFLLKRIKFPLPSLERQQEVAAILDAVENLENSYQTVLKQQQELKKSLLHDLLTGQVRVNPALLEQVGVAHEPSPNSDIG